jgi:uncharacterized membrane protein YwaF
MITAAPGCSIIIIIGNYLHLQGGLSCEVLLILSLGLVSALVDRHYGAVLSFLDSNMAARQWLKAKNTNAKWRQRCQAFIKLALS